MSLDLRPTKPLKGCVLYSISPHVVLLQRSLYLLVLCQREHCWLLTLLLSGLLRAEWLTWQVKVCPERHLVEGSRRTLLREQLPSGCRWATPPRTSSPLTEAPSSDQDRAAPAGWKPLARHTRVGPPSPGTGGWVATISSRLGGDGERAGGREDIRVRQTRVLK